MFPFQIQQRLLAYLEDDAMLPLIRRVINEACDAVCNSNMANRDYGFLKTSTTITGFTTSNRTQSLPSDCRTVIDLEDTTRPAADFSVKGERTVYYSGSSTTGATVTVHYFRQHPVVALNSYWTGTGTGSGTSIVLSSGASSTADAYNDYYLYSGGEYRRISDYDGGTKTCTIESAFTTSPAGGAIVVRPHIGRYCFDATWTASDPPESDILVPKEFHELVMWWALDLLYEHEIEVAANRQILQQRLSVGVEELRSNYSVQIYPNVMPSAPTAEWLVVHGCLKVKGERGRMQMLNMVNNITSDISDALKLAAADRPVPIVAYATALPAFKTKTAPQDLWFKAMMFHATMSVTPPDKEKQGELQLAMAAYQQAIQSFKDTFYSIAVSDVTTGTSTPMTTYGDMVAYLRSNLKSYKSEAQLWTIVNGGIADIMRRIDINRLVSQYTFNTVAATSTYTLPATVRKIISVTVDSEPIPGRSLNDYRDYMTHPEVMGSGYETTQSFIFIAGELRFFETVDAVYPVVVNYHPRHAFVAVAATSIPVDSLLLLKYLEARVSLMSGDMKMYQVLVQEYMAGVQMEYENQDDNVAKQDYMKNAYPSTSQMLSDMSGYN